MKLSCVLFDLDGTLVDTAPDLIACLNYGLTHHGFPAASPDDVKPHVSFGAIAMINASLEKSVAEEKRAAILTMMLIEYENNIARHSVFFDGILDVLDFIEANNLSWGIVTNKRERFALPLILALNLQSRAACVICGDTTPNPKPHPAPLFAACEKIGVSADECVYIGDAAHDILAGKSAKMLTLAATYGYINTNENPENWGANALIHSPKHLLYWLENALW
ncbi:MAG: hypothetical protein RL236_1691 [Pseudomonadota bacterium]